MNSDHTARSGLGNQSASSTDSTKVLKCGARARTACMEQASEILSVPEETDGNFDTKCSQGFVFPSVLLHKPL
jgi:hypothetical protein